MRKLAVILLCLLSLWGHAQKAVPVKHAYRDKYNFVFDNDYFYSYHYNIIGDSLQKLMKMADEAEDLEFKGELQLFDDRKRHREGRISDDSLLNDLRHIAATANSSGLRYLEADALQMLGDIYGENNQRQSTAIEYYISAYAIYKNFTPDEFPPKQGHIYTLGSTFYRYEDYESAIRYMQEAMRSQQTTNNNAFCSIPNTIGMAYRLTKRYDSALKYFQITYEQAQGLKNQAWMGIAQGNTGITYFLQGKYREAIPLLQIDIQTSLSTNNVKNAVASMTILASVYNDMKQYDSAQLILDKALHAAWQRPFWPTAWSTREAAFTQLYRVSAVKGNYKLAYQYADSAIAAKDSLGRQNDAVVLAKANERQNFIQHKLEGEKMQNRIKISELELGKKRIETTFASIGVAILLVVIVFIARERKRSENLLLNILPEKIAERLKRKEHPIADYFDHASILFIDMAGFTVFSDGRNPKEVVNLLNHIFTGFDNIADKYGLEKIKTIGDCYMAVSGLPEPRSDHAEAATRMALEVKNIMKGYRAADGTPLEFRIGLDCGPVVAGVIGRRKFIYDLWGDTVNTASRMESTGVAGEIHCTDRFKIITDHRHKFVSRGLTEVKGKGQMETWLIIE